MIRPRIVIDTNVLVAALRSTRGASHRLLRHVDSSSFELHVSVPLILEYEAAAKRQVKDSRLTFEDVETIVDYLCSVAKETKVYYLWRPVLKDPKDEMVLEVAVAAGCGYIVTFNVSDFRGAEQFGIRVVTPKEFLTIIGDLP